MRNIIAVEFEYDHLCIAMSPGRMIFAVSQLWLSQLQWVLNLLVFNIYIFITHSHGSARVL